MRAIGLDVHRDFCEVAISEDGAVRSAGRIETTPEQLELFARSLGAEDRVALEVTGNALGDRADPRAARGRGRGRLAERHRDPPGAGEDRPARRADAGEAAVRRASSTRSGCPIERTGRCAGGSRAAAQLVAAALAGEERDPRGADALPERSRRRSPTCSASRAGPGWPSSSLARRGARDGRLGAAPGRLPRREIAEVERLIARAALASAGDQAADDRPGRQRDRRRDLHGRRRRHPPLREPPQAGRLSRARPARSPVGLGPGRPRADLQAGLDQGPPRAGRGELVDGPPARADRAFYERIRARRGHQIAIVAVRAQARLPVLVPAQPRRGLRLRAAVADARRSCAGSSLPPAPQASAGQERRRLAANAAMRKAERELARQAEVAYRRTVADWQQAQGRRAPARHRGAHLVGRQAAKQRGRSKPRACALAGRLPTPEPNSRK